MCEPSVDTFVRTLTFTMAMLQSVRNPHLESARNSARFHRAHSHVDLRAGNAANIDILHPTTK
jgi:hypothetical protein